MTITEHPLPLFADAVLSTESPPLPALPADAHLHPGDAGPDVRLLQRALRLAGYLLEIDGRFGPLTDCCLRSFQGTHGLSRTGSTTPDTWAALGGVSFA